MPDKGVAERGEVNAGGEKGVANPELQSEPGNVLYPSAGWPQSFICNSRLQLPEVTATAVATIVTATTTMRDGQRTKRVLCFSC